MAAYRRVYDSRHLQADCQEPGPAPEPYARQLSMGYLNLFYSKIRLHGAAVVESGEAAEYCYEPVCLCVCTNVARISEETTVESLPISARAACGCGSVLLWWRRGDTLQCTSGFADDVTFNRVRHRRRRNCVVHGRYVPLDGRHSARFQRRPVIRTSLLTLAAQ